MTCLDRRGEIIQLKGYCKTDPGRKRKHNEDVCYVNSEDNFFLVADGVGGAASGEVASGLFLDTVKDCFYGAGVVRSIEELVELVNACFNDANHYILSNSIENPDNVGMGCTAELLSFFKNNVIIGHVGDSRTYLLREGVLTRLTRDHSFVEEQIKAGLLDPSEARSHHMRNVILKAVGVESVVEPDVTVRSVMNNDLFLLCTDGLTDLVEDSDIAVIVNRPSSLENRVDALVKAANHAGGTDNIAVTMIEARL